MSIIRFIINSIESHYERMTTMKHYEASIESYFLGSHDGYTSYEALLYFDQELHGSVKVFSLYEDGKMLGYMNRTTGHWVNA